MLLVLPRLINVHPVITVLRELVTSIPILVLLDFTVMLQLQSLSWTVVFVTLDTIVTIVVCQYLKSALRYD